MYFCKYLINWCKTLWNDKQTPGVKVDLYGRQVTLTSCDPFTKTFLASEGVDLAPGEPSPPDKTQVVIKNLSLSEKEREAAKKSSFLNDRTIKALPLLLGLNGGRIFVIK